MGRGFGSTKGVQVKKYPFKAYHFRSRIIPDDYDPTVYDHARPLPTDAVLREAGLDTWAIGVTRREMAERT